MHVFDVSETVNANNSSCVTDNAESKDNIN